MKAPKNIIIKLPEDIENVELNMMQYRIAESRNAYLRLIKQRSIEYYKSKNEEDEQLSKYNLTLIDQAIDNLKEHLEKERRDYKPLGYKFNEEVIEIEMDMCDTIEEQIEYLKRKIEEYDLLTVDVTTNEYDDVKRDLKQQIINRYNKMKNTNVDWEGYLFNENWDTIVEEHFKPQLINHILDQVGVKNEDKFKEFMTKKFNRKTIDEWMKEYEFIDKGRQYEELKNAELPEEVRNENYKRITDAKFEVSTVGQYTLQNLRRFEEKYFPENGTGKSDKRTNLKADEILQEIIEIRKNVEGFKKQIRGKRVELKRLLKENESLEKEFDKDVTDFPKNLKEDIISKRDQINSKKREIYEIEKKLWGTVGDGAGLIWRHDRLFDEYKKLMIDEDELFDELKNKSIGRYTDKLKQKIKEALKFNKIEVNDKEMLDIVQEVLGKKIEDEDAWYKEFPSEENDEENYEKEINELLKGRYNIIDETDEYPLFNFDFERIKKYSSKLEPDKARMYLKYILKEFDREKRENNFLFWTQDDIEYLGKNFIINDLTKLEEPPSLEDLGRSARISLAKENFEKNILNEITFIEEKERITRKDDMRNNVGTSFKKNNSDENIFKEYLERGTKYYLEHKHTRLSLIDFYTEMKKYFGDDTALCEKVFYRIVNDVPVIRIFGFDIEVVKRRIEIGGNEGELDLLIEVEKSKVEELLKAIHDYKLEYYMKWEKRYNQNLDDDWLEEQGYTDKNDLSFDLHYNGWLKFYLEDIKNVNLIEMLKWGFSGRMGEFDNIEEKNSVRIFLDDIEKEAKDFKDELVQAYVIISRNFKGSENSKEIKKDDRGDVSALSNELSSAHNIIIKQRNRIRSLEKGITKSDLEKMIVDNNCRKKNGKINYSALGKILGCSNHTAREKCKFFNVT